MAKYSSVYTLSFSVDHDDEHAKDVTPSVLRDAVLMRIARLALEPRSSWFEAFDGPDDTLSDEGPACGHSVCSQNYIDTGERERVAPLEERWEDAWLPWCQRAAEAEGWAIFTVDGAPEIQRIDDPEDGEPLFASDASAIDHVILMAATRSRLHQLAISIHRLTHPED